MESKKALDMLHLTQTAVQYFGAYDVYGGDKKAIKAAKNGLAKQEHIGAVWFPELFESAQAHMADFDTTVLQYAATKPLEKLDGLTYIEYLMNGIGKQKTGIYGIEDNPYKITAGQTFYAKLGAGSNNFGGKGILNFTYNDKTNEIFTHSGYNSINGKNLGWNSNNVNMATDLKKGMVFL